MDLSRIRIGMAFRHWFGRSAEDWNQIDGFVIDTLVQDGWVDRFFEDCKLDFVV